MKPYVVFKGRGIRLIKDLEKIPGIVVQFSTNGWRNDSLTCDYLKRVIGHLTFNERLLVWDAYRCHTSEATRRELDKFKIHAAVIPGGCTKFIQAPDVVWNTIFKSHMRQCYDFWLSEPSTHEFTRSGNLKPPSRSLLCQWVKLAWEAIPSETIIKSFLSCAITTAVDGSNDNEIHCFKPGQPCESGRLLLQQEMSQLNDSMQALDNDDPFASDEDEEENEANEACVDDDELPDEEVYSSDTDTL